MTDDQEIKPTRAQPEFKCLSKRNVTISCPTDGSNCAKVLYPGNDFTSVVSEWDLVCGDAYRADLVQSFVMGGFLVGSLVFGALADKYGRRPICYIGFLSAAIATVLGAFAPNLHVYYVIRFVVGMCVGGFGLVSFVLCCEVVGPSQRGLVGTATPILFATGIGVYTILAYFVRDWRILTLVTSTPGILAFYHCRILPESPRWLLSQGYIKEAENLLEFFAVQNYGKKPEVPIKLKSVNESASDKSTTRGGSGVGVLTLLKHKKMRNRTIILVYTWFVNCAVYYGLTLSAGNLGSNLYVSVALSGLVEVPSCLLALALMNRIGRKPTKAWSMVIGGIFCLAILTVPTDYPSTKTCLSVLGKMAICVSFCVVWLYSAELYPTSIRNKAMSICNMSARLGGVISPMIVTIGKTRENFDFIIFGGMTLLAGVVSLRLPETLGLSLPETLADLDVPQKSASAITRIVISEDKVRLLQQEIESSDQDA